METPPAGRTPHCRPGSALFPCAKYTLQTPHPQSEKLRMKLKKLVEGENLEVLCCELECPRSARQTAVLRENFEDLHHRPDDHAQLECQRSARQTAAGERKKTQSALPPTAPPSADDASPQNAAGFGPEKSWALRQPAQGSQCRAPA